MSSERLEHLEDGVTRVLDELKAIIYHQLPELRGGISLLTVYTDKYFYCVLERRRQEIRSAERLLEEANGCVSNRIIA